MPRLCVNLLTYNDEARVATALRSVAWAEEVLVVDSCSTDRTLEICRQFANVRVVVHPWEGFVAQRRFALMMSDADWILIVDSDEQVSPELRVEIEQVLASEPHQVAFRIPRADYLGKLPPAEYPYGTVVSFFRRDRMSFAGDPPHVLRVADGPVGRLRHPLLHDSFRNLQYTLGKQTGYAFRIGERMAADGQRFSIWSAVGHSVAAFLRRYLLKQGFRFGARGFVLAVLQAHYTFLKHARLWEVTELEAAVAPPPSAPTASPSDDSSPSPLAPQ
jgi:glycosyltransferase involved in cell wall biosynthesis